ncbi:signal peptidase II [Sinanaerobacter chloroacetimidivorans]|jgi:signal peptidase II|uniref:Lipoprotein signal peptidase n=1 Tax=Sinanaerobacter chloroacetimidivorans TaxID=2818044 RepID=A0A8J7VXC6_9FIRM|nr:signal peptidase II [Sinanaerobacter chloroacetimidivorans]MBR0596789.1 signal peptidase II [Sinanaerobacter chloroacetimidivorans]
MYFIIIAVIVILDQLTKYFIQAGMELNSSAPLIDGVFHLTYIHNYGAAFSILQNQTILLILLPLAVTTAVLVYLARKRKTEHWMLLLSMSFIVAGGIGNLIDRIGNGYVVDFFDIRVFPIFNVADISVCVGCGLLILFMFVVEPKIAKEKKKAEEQ